MSANTDPGLFLGKGKKAAYLRPKLANRHGLIAGATGTGKTVTLQILAEQFSARGVPVFMSDVKGDLSGISQAGVSKDFLEERAETIGLEDYNYQGFPVTFWDLYGKKGHRLRTTVSEMGPLLLARLLELNETQEGVLYIAFTVADDNGLLLLDLKDLRAMLVYLSENSKEISAEYGNVSKASIGAIQRRLLVLERSGAKNFLGEPALDLRDFMRVDRDGYGQINVLSAEKLMENPKLYSTFMLWLLSELFEELPEIGDPEQPELVFFFDEAHLLFNNAPKALIEKVEQVVRLIRSKGVGVYFVTQNPLDVPETVLGQLGNRVQHALRAFTPRDQKAVRAAAQTFRANPAFDAETAITELGVGEALVSTLMKKGTPSVVQRVLIRPPSSRLGPAKPSERRAIIEDSPFVARYDQTVDRKSAYEMLKERGDEQMKSAEEVETEQPQRKGRSTRAAKPRKSNRQGFVETFAKSVLRSLGSAVGRKLVRGVMGSLLKG